MLAKSAKKPPFFFTKCLVITKKGFIFTVEQKHKQKNIMKNSTTDKQTVAREILNQLGGNKFLAMTGSHSLCSDTNMLRMKLRRNASGASYLRITLNSMDTYDVEFFKVRSGEIKMVKEFNGVYSDMLVSIFEQTTGFYTSL